MSWYAFHGYNNNHAIDASAFDGAELNALGMHGYPTQAQAEAKPNSVNFLQTAVVNAAIDDYNNARDISPTVANNPTNPASGAVAAAKGGSTAVKKATQDAGKLLGTFTIGGISGTNLVIRGGKMIIGAILIFIGVAHLSGLKDKVPGVAGKALKAAPLL